MFCPPATDPFAPHAKAAGFHFSTHESNYVFFFEAILKLDRLKRGAIFPGHLNNAIAIVLIEFRGELFDHAHAANIRIPIFILTSPRRAQRRPPAGIVDLAIYPQESDRACNLL